MVVVGNLCGCACRQTSFTTANELHVPVGRPVRIELEAEDVIHSFWVPNLAGKQDLIPGRAIRFVFTVDRPGTYRGQCAEFCGLQHAHMALLVDRRSSRTIFERWRDAQLAAAAAPATPEQGARARRVRWPKPAPPATRCAARRRPARSVPISPMSAAASTSPPALLPTTRGSLAAWIADPQTIKPGNNMPHGAAGAATS